MSKIEFGKNCPLTQYLEEVSRLAGDGLKGPLAGALLYELGYPQFIQKLPDITITSQLVKQIVKASQTSLILESAEKCSNCPQSGSCKVGELIKVS